MCSKALKKQQKSTYAVDEYENLNSYQAQKYGGGKG